MKTYVFRVVVEPDDDRWVAYAPALKDQGGATWGMTRADALAGLREVIKMTVASMREHHERILEEPVQDVLVLDEPPVTVTV